MDQKYRNQVQLLLSVIPEVAKESCFALHGGTAINLFIHNMPRLSVDIDLTYTPIEDRETTLININASLDMIKQNISHYIPASNVQHNASSGKLLVSNASASIKIEVNLVARGTIEPSETMILCEKAQEDFDTFCEMRVVHTGQLYGGKICAALDRQHPRDLFDIKKLFNTTGINQDIKAGFLLSLLSTNRPAYEILNPNLLDQSETYENHFVGMATEEFSYNDFEITREQLITQITELLTETDKKFLLSFHDLGPSWDTYNFQHFPAIKWKLQNLSTLKEKNPEKFNEQINKLNDTLCS